MKVKTRDLTGAALDWAVAKAEGWSQEGLDDIAAGDRYPEHAFSTCWAQGGPIIERHLSKLFKNVGGTYTAQIRHEEDHPLVTHKVLAGWTNCSGPTALIAAMRCYVAFKLGDEIDIPEELCAL